MINVKRRKEKLALRIIKGGLVPADAYTQKRLREKGYKVNDVVFAVITKPRNPRFNGLVHKFGEIVADNIDDFENYDPHKVLKRIQTEALIGCEENVFRVPGVGLITQYVPRSLSFESMDEGEFHEIFKAMCNHIAKHYWTSLSSEQIAEMIQVMVEI